MHNKERQSRGFNPRLDHLFDRYSMKHMVNNRMFTNPLSLNAIGAAGGLTAPISMLALRGKTIYNSLATATLIPSGTSISLSIFENKSFTSPGNPIVFTRITSTNTAANSTSATISQASKRVSSLGIGPFGFGESFDVGLENGSAIPFYINISIGSAPGWGGITSYRIDNDNNKNYYNKSYYFGSGYIINTRLEVLWATSFEATISDTAIYPIVNFNYSTVVI
jgi:hypothetical protein